jgi:hypothetical protein
MILQACAKNEQRANTTVCRRPFTSLGTLQIVTLEFR